MKFTVVVEQSVHAVRAMLRLQNTSNMETLQDMSTFSQ